jgi:hypothetical protein
MSRRPPAVGLPELFVAVLIAGVSLINAAPPAAAYLRSRDPRFVLLSAGHGVLALLGALWTWGELPPLAPPSWAAAPFPILLLVLVVALLFLATSVWPRKL